MKFFKSILLLCISGLLSACSPGFDSNVSVEPIIFDKNSDTEDTSRLDEPSGSPQIRVENILDSRKEKAIIKVNEREVFPKDNLTVIVQDGLRKRLKSRNFTHSYLAECKIDGEIKSWKAEITPAFPTTEIKAEAEIKLSISNASRKYYDGVYSGEMSLKHPNLTEAKASEMLAETMGQAIIQAFSDEGFDQKLMECGSQSGQGQVRERY